MKKFRRMMALVIAMVMTLSMGIVALAATHSITINQSEHDAATHTYGAYQIFAGDVDTTTNQLTNITWGSNVDNSKLAALASGLNAMRNTTTPEYPNALTATSTAAAFADAIGKLAGSGNDTEKAQAIAESLSKIITGSPKTGSYTTENAIYKITDLADGYYLVQDTEAPTITTSSDNSGAKTRYILQLVNDVTVTEKADAPSVDKSVQDNDDKVTDTTYDNNGFGETADHAINESFQFKLTATIPANVDLAKYDTYKVVFTDTMSTGVTFESLASVKINNNSVNSEKYTCTASANQKGGDWTLTFADILPLLTDAEKAADVTIEVVYNAHLNEDATVYDADQTDEDANDNKVKLEYSNNPNAAGDGETGETKEDYVFTFTYKVDNTKYSESIAESHKLADAGFKLYDEAGTTEIGLIWEASKNAYRPIKAGETAVEMKSQADGTFNIIGLDAGTYTLKETSVPAGLNPAADVTIKIVAKHKENASTKGADLTLTGSEKMDNSVVNKSGTVLPSTGGIGTTMFYVVGAILVLGAATLLVTKRRMDVQ